ncbi:GNAT family N-acetyltransferase [Emticicia soli]|uniref:GNAT family N-acetyltransferase n=1 Tax=Emticicia soli TaxID=2027878 RepID=A0ABW5J9I5_9BACT
MYIKPLTRVKNNPTINWGHNGYTTSHIFEIKTIETESGFSFMMEKVEKSYYKTWHINEDDIADLNAIIYTEYSFGAYENDELIAWAICDYRNWNNTIYIDNFLIAEKYRNKGIGKQLIQAIKNKAKECACRVVELETQNTNVPAIEFYLKQGFKITGINQKLYDGENAEEVAIFMSFDIQP